MGSVSRIGGLTVYTFDASQLGVIADPGQIPLSPDDVAARPGIEAALDGVQFDTCDGQSYAQSQCARPVFMVYDAASGVAQPGSHPNAGFTLSVVNGSAVTILGSQAAPGATVAVQLWPSLIEGGQITASNSGSNAQQEQRAALAVMGPTQLAFVIGSGTMVDFANAILALGATDAGYTDGGGSTSLVIPGQHIYGAAEHRRVATWLVARQAGLDSVSGSGILVAIGAAVLAGFGIHTVLKRRSKR